jgi:2-oxoisovalerate dehydrogenase E1 component beta subunit
VTEVTYLEAIREGLREEMERDERVFLIGEDIGAFGGAFKVTDGLQQRFGEHCVVDARSRRSPRRVRGRGAHGHATVCEMQFIDFMSNAYSILTNYVATARYRAEGCRPRWWCGASGGGVRWGPFHPRTPRPAISAHPASRLSARRPRATRRAHQEAIRDDDPVLYLGTSFSTAAS